MKIRVASVQFEVFFPEWLMIHEWIKVSDLNPYKDPKQNEKKQYTG